VFSDVHSFKTGENKEIHVTRRQFPLTPGFAVTLQCAQGLTHHGKLVAEINAARGDANGPMATYVAASRVTDFDNNFAVLGKFEESVLTGVYKTKAQQTSKDRHYNAVKREMRRLRESVKYVTATPELVARLRAKAETYVLDETDDELSDAETEQDGSQYSSDEAQATDGEHDELERKEQSEEEQGDLNGGWSMDEADGEEY